MNNFKAALIVFFPTWWQQKKVNADILYYRLMLIFRLLPGKGKKTQSMSTKKHIKTTKTPKQLQRDTKELQKGSKWLQRDLKWLQPLSYNPPMTTNLHYHNEKENGNTVTNAMIYDDCVAVARQSSHSLFRMSFIYTATFSHKPTAVRLVWNQFYIQETTYIVCHQYAVFLPISEHI